MIESHFKNIENQLIQKLSTAKSRVYLAVAWFTNETLFSEVIRCCHSGADVCLIIMDDYINRNEYSLNFSKLIEAGGKLFFTNEKKMHNKFCIIDNLIITGSYNWTYYAEKLNYENIVISDEISLVNSYIDNFNRIKDSCNSIKEYIPLALVKMTEEDRYNDYKYLCNDVALKGKDYRERIIEFNKSNNISVNIEIQDNYIDYDNRGVPLLKKEFEPSHIVFRLNYISIGVVPVGRPYAGRKYVHAKLCSNSIWLGDDWVDIFDKEFVNDLISYFHVSDGGTLENLLPLPSIPEDIYNPRKKYGFKRVNYLFYKFGKYGNKRQKIGTDGRILVNDEGQPYLFDHFITLIRCDAINKKYIEFSSMTELCQMLIQSLFAPNGFDDYDIVGDYLLWNGVFKASIDDFRNLCITECTEHPNAVLNNEQIKSRLINNLNGFWIHKETSIIMCYAYGVFSNRYDYYPTNEYEFSHSDNSGSWFILIRLKETSIHNPDRYDKLINKMTYDLRSQGKIGIVYYCSYLKITYFERIGFKRDKQLKNKNNEIIYRMILKL